MTRDRSSVTVLIATRDRLELLRRALDSVWDQDHAGEIHVVCVFDGEIPANHGLVARETHGPRRLTVVGNTSRPGLAATRNLGLEHVDTTFVATCDDDDTWYVDKLSRQLALASRQPDGVCYGGGLRIVGGTAPVDRPAPLGTVVLADLLRDRIMELHPSTLLMRTADVLAIGGWDEQIPGGYAEDYDLLLRLARRGPIHCLEGTEGIVSEILWAGQSQYFSRWPMIGEALEHLLAKFPEFASQPHGRARIHGQIAFARSASGDRRSARHHARLARADHLLEPRALLAHLVAGRPARAEFVQRTLHTRGRGV